MGEACCCFIIFLKRQLGVILTEPAETQVVRMLQLSLRGHIQCAGSKKQDLTQSYL